MQRLVRQVVPFLLFLTIAILPATAQLPPDSTLQTQSNPTELVKQGKAAYEQGKFSEAIRVLQQAEVEFEKSGNWLQQVMVLSNLSLAYQQQGEWTQAENAITKSLELLRLRPENSTQQQQLLLAAALEVQGKLQLTIADPETALRTWQEAAKYFDEVGDRTGVVRTQIHQSLALQELGFHQQALKTLMQSITLWKSQPTSIQATAYRSLGNLLLMTGEVKAGQETLEQALPFLQESNEQRLDQIQKSQQESLKRTKLLLSHKLLEKSREIFQSLAQPQNEAEVLLDLGNVSRSAYYRARDSFERVGIPSIAVQVRFKDDAIRYYQSAQQVTNSILKSITNIQAQLNQLSLLIEFEKATSNKNASSLKTATLQLQEILDRTSTLQAQITRLPISQATIYAQINLAQSLIKWYSPLDGEKPEIEQIQQLLNDAVTKASQLQNPRIESYALGHRAAFYEKIKPLEQAQSETWKALKLAEGTRSFDIAYQWQWQLGRILKEQSKAPGKNADYRQAKLNGAIAAYKEAVQSLNLLRQDLLSLNSSDTIFLFRDAVEPVYRELVDLLLQSAPTVTSQSQTKQQDKNSSVAFLENLEAAYRFIQDLQVLELENFLRCGLQNAAVAVNQTEQLESFAATAMVYPISLSDRLAILLRLPNRKELLQYTVPVSQDELETTIQEFQKIIQIRDTSKKAAAKLYDWLIRPIETNLSENNIKTLVFTLDSNLRNLSIAALYDQQTQQYFVQKGYGITLNLGQPVLNNQPLQKGQFQVLAAGIEAEYRGDEVQFEALEFAKRELDQIQKEVPGSKQLFNQEFTRQKLQDEINSKPFPVVHLATHGLFGASAENTFILAHQERINLSQIRDTLRGREEKRPEAIELLVLSACETAKGDPRSVLGIAGIAVQAGARSTIASLFKANDAATFILMSRLYQVLGRSDVTKAEALRLAQLAVLEQGEAFESPYYWASFVLVGGWR